MNEKEEIRDHIRKNYTEVALKGASGGGCCGGGCSCGTISVDVGGTALAEATVRLGYSEEDLAKAPSQANMGLGCGNPLAIAALKEGETVLDLGSGGGFDCFLARAKVGAAGQVIGVDMTPEMIKLARNNARKSGYVNVEFRLGEIEHLPVADETVDVIISNCVINLAQDKELVFREAFRVLKDGGRLAISDVAATAPLPEAVRRDLALISGCIGGAEYVENLKSMLEKAGFQHIRLIPKDNSKEIIHEWAPDINPEEFVASYSIEAVKGSSKGMFF